MLPEKVINQLIAVARNARENAHAPYSGYRVGAALLDGQGKIHGGCNVENASFGLSICAERHVIGMAVASGAQDIKAILVLTISSPPASPCGACRQVMAEFGDFPVILANLQGEKTLTSVGELLPMAFSSEQFEHPTSNPAS